MAISQIELQYRYSGKGPVDAKSIAKTFETLLLPETWYNDAGKVVAYNGMLVAVWLDPDKTKNGVYLLHDSAVTNIIKTPDVTNAANWLKLADMSELTAFANRLASVEADFKQLAERVSALEDDSDVLTYGYRSGFPTTGETGKLYVAVDEGKSYIWFDDKYMPVGGQDQPDVINGGKAD